MKGYGVTEIVFSTKDNLNDIKDKEKYPCVEWHAYYQIQKTVLIGISIGITLLNSILRVFLRKSTEM